MRVLVVCSSGAARVGGQGPPSGLPRTTAIWASDTDSAAAGRRPGIRSVIGTSPTRQIQLGTEDMRVFDSADSADSSRNAPEQRDRCVMCAQRRRQITTLGTTDSGHGSPRAHIPGLRCEILQVPQQT
nr:hypothetical protein JVH1_4174 [Rhodococcus sp. JVH1]